MAEQYSALTKLLKEAGGDIAKIEPEQINAAIAEDARTVREIIKRNNELFRSLKWAYKGLGNG